MLCTFKSIILETYQYTTLRTAEVLVKVLAPPAYNTVRVSLRKALQSFSYDSSSALSNEPVEHSYTENYKHLKKNNNNKKKDPHYSQDSFITPVWGGSEHTHTHTGSSAER